MATGWYVLQTYSGHENKIEKKIRLMIENGELDKNVICDVKIPCEEVIEVKDGKKRVSSKKIIPGYILVEMDISGDDTDWKDPCTKIKKIPGVASFLKMSKESKPQPISGDEARSILQKSGEIKGERTVRAKQAFTAGERVKIIDGPFASFVGVIEEVNHEKNKLKVMVGIFGRNAPVEVDILQVEKV